jgi:hypothetical protein
MKHNDFVHGANTTLNHFGYDPENRKLKTQEVCGIARLNYCRRCFEKIDEFRKN